MQAFILAAGPCTRLRPLTDDKHKCLIEVADGRTVLDTELVALRENGIADIVISVGHFAEKIQQHIEERYPDLSVTYVSNERYAETNCIYSMWLAREHITEDVVYLTGDLVFDPPVLTKLIAAGKNVMYVNPKMPLPKKDFKARVSSDGFITEIGVDVFGDDARFCWPLYYLSNEAWMVWMNEVDRFVQEGRVGVYSEVAFNAVQSAIKLKPANIDDFCTEVDDEEDLALARQYYAQP